MIKLSMLQYQNTTSIVPIPYSEISTIEHFFRQHRIAGFSIIDPKKITKSDMAALKEEGILDESQIPDAVPTLKQPGDTNPFMNKHVALLISYFDANAVKEALWEIYLSPEYEDYISEQTRKSMELDRLAKEWNNHPGPISYRLNYACLKRNYMDAQCGDDD